MLTIKKFKDDIFLYFRVMVKADSYLDLAYKGRLYRLEVTDIGPAPPQRRRRKRQSPHKKIKKGKCPECGGLALNDICMAPANH
jgi:hypothetical protein